MGKAIFVVIGFVVVFGGVFLAGFSVGAGAPECPTHKEIHIQEGIPWNPAKEKAAGGTRPYEKAKGQ